MDETRKISKIIFDSSKLPILLGAIFGYFIGGGFVSYLGKNIDWAVFCLGLGIVLLFLLCSEYVSAIFYWKQPTGSGEVKDRLLVKNIFLQLGLSVLCVGAVITFFLFFLVTEKLGVWVFLALFFVLNIVSVIPPLDLRNRGYGDLLSAVNLAILAPAFAGSLQLDEIHHSLLMITFPGFFLVVAMFMALSLEKYGSTAVGQKPSLMTAMGWKSGMYFHNLFLLLTYFSYAITAILGLPFRLLLPAIVAFPFSVLQFWEMSRIGSGEKPRWKFLRLCAISSIGILVYFLLFNLWLE
jgi:1,4-dihydroxy-2-naphthoate octaprenyltransferase